MEPCAPMTDERLAELRVGVRLTFDEQDELLAEVDRLRADARLGAALRAALATAEYHTLRIIPMMLHGYEVRISGVGMTEEGNRLAAALSTGDTNG